MGGREGAGKEFYEDVFQCEACHGSKHQQYAVSVIHLMSFCISDLWWYSPKLAGGHECKLIPQELRLTQAVCHIQCEDVLDTEQSAR